MITNSLFGLWIVALTTTSTTLALVPRQTSSSRSSSQVHRRGGGWQPQRPSSSSSSSSSSSRLGYFDDCERQGVDQDLGDEQQKAFWKSRYHEEKQQAMDRLLGYSPHVAAQLTEEQVELETLQWALDTHLIPVDHDNDNDNDLPPPFKSSSSRYSKITNLFHAPSTCRLSSLSYLWHLLVQFLDHAAAGKTMENNDHDDDVYLITFAKAQDLFDYDTMVTMLQAVTISQPLLNYRVKMDLFHPNYKHAPKFWSPETHSPFPTLAVTLVPHHNKRTASDEDTTVVDDKDDDDDLNAIRKKLNALFESLDADETTPVLQQKEQKSSSSSSLDDETTTASKSVLEACQAFLPNYEGKWVMSMDQDSTTRTMEPCHLYESLWKTVTDMVVAVNADGNKNDSSMLVVPPTSSPLDSYTTHRVAITVQAALQKLDVPVRITNVHHPSSSSPFPMIQLERQQQPKTTSTKKTSQT